MFRTIATAACLLACWISFAAAQQSPADTVDAHFQAILAEDFVGADSYFSAAFLRAFKPDVQRLNEYYQARAEQLSRGYEILSTVSLADDDHQTAAVVVDFASLYPDAPESATERLYYYLIYEKAAAGAPGADREGWAWRIDIFDAFEYATLADARRRHYLYTNEAWPEDESRELKSRQGLFRIQVALEMFYRDQGQYPLRLLGDENRRDELIGSNTLADRYPPCGFADRPMRSVNLDERSSGDFTYLSVDTDGDERRDGYWLLLHGKVPGNFVYEDLDIVYLLDPAGAGQLKLAVDFAQYWQEQMGQTLELADQFVAAAASEPLPSIAEADLPPAMIGMRPTEVTPIEPVLPMREASNAGSPPTVAEAAAPESPEAVGLTSTEGSAALASAVTGEAAAAAELAAGEPSVPALPSTQEQAGRQPWVGQRAYQLTEMLMADAQALSPTPAAVTPETPAADEPVAEESPLELPQPVTQLKVFHYGF